MAVCHHTGQYFIAWQQQVNQITNDNIFGRMMSGAGVLDQSYGFADTTLPQQYPRLSCNSAGTEFLLTWQDVYGANFYPGVGIWAEVVRLDKIVEPAFEVVRPSDTRDRLYPAVAYGRENALVVWQHARDNTNYLDIWGQVVRPH